jgi:cytoskeletal protein RodZ
LKNFSQISRVRGRASRKKHFLGYTLVGLVVVLIAVAVVQNRGLRVVLKSIGVDLKLDPTEQTDPSVTTHNDGSPIVTAPGADVEVHVTGPTRSAPAHSPAKEGMSTHGAASPIVTGQGAVVKSTVDTRP